MSFGGRPLAPKLGEYGIHRFEPAPPQMVPLDRSTSASGSPSSGRPCHCGADVQSFGPQFSVWPRIDLVPIEAGDHVPDRLLEVVRLLAGEHTPRCGADGETV